MRSFSIMAAGMIAPTGDSAARTDGFARRINNRRRVTTMAKAYVLRSDQYLRFDMESDAVDVGYPKKTTDGWSGLTGTGFEQGIDAVLDLGTGKAYFFKGAEYVRVDQTSISIDGPPRSIAENWAGLADAGFADDLDATVNWGNGKVYFFKGDSYARFDIAGDRVDPGYPQPIANGWAGLAAAGFADSLDAAVLWNNGKAYFFKGGSYVRFDVAADRVDAEPRPIADGWRGFDAAGFGAAIDAIWVKLTGPHGGGGGPTGATSLGPGDHVWYYNGMLSRDLDIPRGTWFPGSTSPTDYRGHGDEIFNFVIHANGEIRRGRPHMRNREGTHAWLNNNPGNLTGVVGGADFGQYRDKFNWHHFLIFPSYQAGYDAIARFLRSGGYRDLNITQAFHRYAPASDGNDPDGYANSVAAAAGVPTTTLVRDLSDAQMRHMQDKIVQIEGSVEGITLSPGSPELPNEIRSQLAQ
jgi:hypothetical protein